MEEVEEEVMVVVVHVHMFFLFRLVSVPSVNKNSII
jgi:hypothetical protein